MRFQKGLKVLHGVDVGRMADEAKTGSVAIELHGIQTRLVNSCITDGSPNVPSVAAQAINHTQQSFSSRFSFNSRS